MLNGVIIRGTNPVHEFELPDNYGLELIQRVRVIYGQNGESIFVKTWDGNDNTDCKLEGNKITVFLTQEDTYLISPSQPLYIEIRIRFKSGKVISSEEPIGLRVLDTMDEGVVMTDVQAEIQ